MDFVGVSTTDPVTKVTIGGTIITTFQKGDVIIYGNKEYVYADNTWHEFGDVSANSQAISELQELVNYAKNDANQITTLSVDDRIANAVEDVRTTIASLGTNIMNFRG